MKDFLDGFVKVNGTKTGGSYVNDPSVKFRLVLHTTETDGGALTMAKTHPWSPHFWVDPETKEKYQVISLNRSAYALAHPRGTVETNAMKSIQIEIVGRAAQTQDWPIEWYDWLAKEVIMPICKEVGINWNQYKHTFASGENGWVLASKSSPARMSTHEWTYEFGGICCHQHVPVNDHWDCGDLNIERIISVINGAPAVVTPPAAPQPVPEKPVRPATPAPAPKPLTRTTIKLNSSGSLVSMLQKQLAGYGYWIAVDGFFGPLTEHFVKAFQKARGLDVDGIVGPKTWAGLDAATASNWKVPVDVVQPKPTQPKPAISRARWTLRIGSSGSEVVKLQNMLRALGQDVVADGDFGPRTDAAVRNIQSFLKIEVDGIYGQNSAKAFDVWLLRIGM